MKRLFIFINCIAIILAFCLGAMLSCYENSYGILSVVQPEISDSGRPKIETEEQQGKININTATKEKLCELYGIAEKLSARIIRYREANGEFRQIQDIMKVNGIGKKVFEKIKCDICV